jgi:hypothetical protein
MTPSLDRSEVLLDDRSVDQSEPGSRRHDDHDYGHLCSGRQAPEETAGYERVRRREFSVITRLTQIGRLLIVLRIAQSRTQYLRGCSTGRSNVPAAADPTTPTSRPATPTSVAGGSSAGKRRTGGVGGGCPQDQLPLRWRVREPVSVANARVRVPLTDNT